MSDQPLSRIISDQGPFDKNRLDRRHVESGQCWLVFVKKGQFKATVRVLDVDANSVVLRDVHNADMVARYDRTDVDFRYCLD